MSKETIFSNVVWLILTIVMVLVLWGVGKLFADTVSDYKTISPEPGVKCVVVSRMFNTSVDCWKVDNG